MTVIDAIKLAAAAIPVLGGIGAGAWIHLERDAADRLELRVLRCQNDAMLAGKQLRDAQCWEIVLR